MLFLKPTSSYLENGGTIEIPEGLESLHHEVELAVVIGQKARDVPEAAAMDYVGGLVCFLHKNVLLIEFLISLKEPLLLHMHIIIMIVGFKIGFLVRLCSDKIIRYLSVFLLFFFSIFVRVALIWLGEQNHE